MKLKVLKDSVLIQPFVVEEKSKGGIIVELSKKKEKKSEGKVVGVGEKVEYVKIGDQVVYAKYAGIDLVDPTGKELILVKEVDVLAIIY